MHNLHSLPFHIDYDGPALVSKGFPVSAVDSDASASSSSLSKYSASFRGRRLTGTARQLPADLKIYQLERRRHQNEPVVDIVGSFDSSNVNVIEWNKEDLPEKPKLTFDSFSRLVSLQMKINDLFTKQ